MNKVQFYPRRLFTSLPSLPSLPSLLYSFLLLCLQLFLFQLELRGLIGLVIEAFQFSNFILYIGIHQLVFTTHHPTCLLFSVTSCELCSPLPPSPPYIYLVFILSPNSSAVRIVVVNDFFHARQLQVFDPCCGVTILAGLD